MIDPTDTTDLTPLTALGDTAPRTRTIGALTLHEDDRLALASLAAPDDAPRPFGMALPAPGGWVAAPDGLGAFWMAQGQWMITGAGAADRDFAAEVALAAPQARVTEQTDAWAAIAITGDAAALALLLERLVNLPPRATAPGRSTRTLLHHMGVFVIRPAADRLFVLGMRSAAGSLWHALATAADRLAGREDAA
ncbi:sarcosine oxidase subunit gamma [Meridianimarinicoccus sp. RP-17]|uniref:sarcosine oxidase subunit gamma n=1 Tax=Meridianimarinicoccus zhengii TaxID=2056810 RepID=UPI001F27200C|nr:sarcosine oxidase subunit gamma [Phycocomes zhengii]